MGIREKGGKGSTSVNATNDRQRHTRNDHRPTNPQPPTYPRHQSSGGGVNPDDSSLVVARFLGVYSNERDGSWRGQLSIFNNSAPFSRVDTLLVPGGASNYTLVSNAPLHFVGRGRMEGVVGIWPSEPPPVEALLQLTAGISRI